MKDFIRLAKRLKEVTVEDQLKELSKIVNRNRVEILGLNKKQLLEGIDSNGESLGEYASDDYARMKRTLNPNGVVDLRLSGRFHNNFFLVSEMPIIIWSYDAKTDLLVKKKGRDIFGLTEENKEYTFKELIIPDFREYQKQLLRLR